MVVANWQNEHFWLNYSQPLDNRLMCLFLWSDFTQRRFHYLPDFTVETLYVTKITMLIFVTNDLYYSLWI